MATRVNAMPDKPNDPHQRARATDVKCNQNGLAGSAACGGWTNRCSFEQPEEKMSDDEEGKRSQHHRRYPLKLGPGAQKSGKQDKACPA